MGGGDDEGLDYYLLNDSYGYNDTIEPPSTLGPSQLTALVCYGLVFLLGVPGNSLVVWVTGFRMQTTVNSVWFLQLALADLLCCLSLPLLMVPLAQDQRWPFGQLACKLLNGMLFLTMYCSVLLLVLISLDRWLLVSRPVWCQNWRQPKYVHRVCMGVWLLALLFSVPHFVYMVEHNVGFDKVECLAVHSVRSAWAVVNLRFLLGFLLPFLVIVVSHSVVYKRAGRSPGQGSGRGQRASARSRRTLWIISALVLSFALCWLPLHVLEFLFLVVSRDSPNRPHLRLAHVLALCLAYFNSCLNPLLYVCLGRSFKESMARSLRSVLNFISEEPPNHSQGQGNSQSTSFSKSSCGNTVDRAL